MKIDAIQRQQLACLKPMFLSTENERARAVQDYIGTVDSLVSSLGHDADAREVDIILYLSVQDSFPAPVSLSYDTARSFIDRVRRARGAG